MLEIVFFALPPWRLRIEVGIGATFYNMSDAVAEAAANFLEHGRAAAVFDDIVQEGGDGKSFIASGFKHQAGDA
jgi:hypothetical protein